MNRNFISIKDDVVCGNLDVFIYENDGCKIAYSPALDLMGYGKNEREARASFEIVLNEFLSKCMRDNTLGEYLQAHGWSKQQVKSPEFISPNPLTKQNETMKRIVNMPKFRKVSQKINRAYC